MIRRLLDWLGLAFYPTNPKIQHHLDMGINAHVIDTVEDFKRMRDMGFTVVRLDPVGDVPAMIAMANEAGIKTMISGTQGLDLEIVFRYWKPHYVCIANEPDQKKYWEGSMADLLSQLIRAMILRDTYSPDTELIFPCASGLSRAAGRYGTRELINWMSAFAGAEDILIGQHVYENTPDQTLRKLNKWIKFYRKHGWKQRLFVTEFGFSDEKGEDRQATYLVNTLSMFSKHPEVAGACVYVWKDDPPENFGILKATGLAKKAALRILSSTATR